MHITIAGDVMGDIGSNKDAYVGEEVTVGLKLLIAGGVELIALMCAETACKPVSILTRF